MPECACTTCIGNDEHVRWFALRQRANHYAPLRTRDESGEPASRSPFSATDLEVTGIVAICDIDRLTDDGPTPRLDMSITQFLRLSDQSLIRLDMDRGITTLRRHRDGARLSKRTADDVRSEVIMLVQADMEHEAPGTFPWEAYAEAAQLRGIDVGADALDGLPFTVLFSSEVARNFAF